MISSVRVYVCVCVCVGGESEPKSLFLESTRYFDNFDETET